MARKGSNSKSVVDYKYKEFSFAGKELSYSGRIYYESVTHTDKCDITPLSLTINGIITIKGCKLFQTDKEAWISFPQYKDKSDSYKDYIYIPREVKESDDEIGGLIKVIEAALA